MTSVKPPAKPSVDHGEEYAHAEAAVAAAVLRPAGPVAKGACTTSVEIALVVAAVLTPAGSVARGT